MCIICNCDDASADAFLASFERARTAMKQAAADMLAVSKTANTPESQARYDRAHKKMVKIVADWNRVEHLREVGA